jgi:hypothetical protein
MRIVVTFLIIIFFIGIHASASEKYQNKVCSYFLEGNAEQLKKITVEVYFSKISNELVYLRIPITEITDLEIVTSGVTGKLRSIPSIMILGSHLYKGYSSDGDSTSYGPLIESIYYDADVSTGRRENMTDQELKNLLLKLERNIPGLVVERRVI